MRIKGAVVVVTGASSGIGQALGRAFAEAGASVALAARSADKLSAFSLELCAEGREVIAAPTDVTDRAQVDQLIAATVERFGRLDILVNNAGRGAAASVTETPVEHFRALFELNVLGAVHTTQAAAPHLRRSGGLILNVSSGAGRFPVPGLSAYGASKAALDLISKTLREELRDDGVRVMTVYPPNTESNAAMNMIGDPAVAIPALIKAISGLVKPEHMTPVPAAQVAGQILDAIAQEPPVGELRLDADMLVDAA